MKPETIERITSNEAIVTKLEMLNSFLQSELNECIDYSLDNKDCIKYGIERGGLISSVLAKIIEKFNISQEENKDKEILASRILINEDKCLKDLPKSELTKEQLDLERRGFLWESLGN